MRRGKQEYPLKLLRKSLDILAEADLKLKTTGANERTVLEQTAAKLILLPRIEEEKANEQAQNPEAVVVEGKHDKIRLAAAVDTLVIETRGLGYSKTANCLGCCG